MSGSLARASARDDLDDLRLAAGDPGDDAGMGHVTIVGPAVAGDDALEVTDSRERLLDRFTRDGLGALHRRDDQLGRVVIDGGIELRLVAGIGGRIKLLPGLHALV